jgi:hypothetical protein
LQAGALIGPALVVAQVLARPADAPWAGRALNDL